MIATVDRQRVARALLTYMAEPGDPVLAAWLEMATPGDAVAAITAGRPPLPGGAARARRAAGREGRARFRAVAERRGDLPAELDLDARSAEGIRLVCPGEPELADPARHARRGPPLRPCGCAVRLTCGLLPAVGRPWSGARASPAYGAHVATEMAATLAERGWTVVSGGAYGIDGCAHRGALAAGGVTIAVLACGVDHVYPRGPPGPAGQRMAAQGVLVSEAAGRAAQQAAVPASGTG